MDSFHKDLTQGSVVKQLLRFAIPFGVTRDLGIKISMAAHGGSVVEIERVGTTGEWRLVTKGRRPYNRRITATTPRVMRNPLRREVSKGC